MIEDNVKKVKEMNEDSLKTLFNNWEQTHQLEPFDIILYGRYKKPSLIIRRIDNECGILKPLSIYYRISVKEKINDNIELLNFIDPEGGPFLSSGVYEYTDNMHISITEIYAKGDIFIIFYKNNKNAA